MKIEVLCEKTWEVLPSGIRIFSSHQGIMVFGAEPRLSPLEVEEIIKTLQLAVIHCRAEGCKVEPVAEKVNEGCAAPGCPVLLGPVGQPGMYLDSLHLCIPCYASHKAAIKAGDFTIDGKTYGELFPND